MDESGVDVIPCYESTNALVDENEALWGLEVKIRVIWSWISSGRRMKGIIAGSLLAKTRDIPCKKLGKDTIALLKNSQQSATTSHSRMLGACNGLCLP